MQNDLKFSGDSPVVINYQGGADDIYAPVRSSSCDINIVSTQILDDLYTAGKNDVCIRIKKGNTTIWEGYKQPNTFSQEVTPNLDNISMTCIDPVSILKFVTIDKLFDHTKVMTYGEVIGRVLSYVMLDTNTLWVERFVTYNSGTDILTMQVQLANFWDEMDEPDTAYQMLEEMLRPFCLTLVYEAGAYQIYSVNKISGNRRFDKYTINSDGSLTLSSSNQSETRTIGLYQFSQDDWKSNNVSSPTVEINSTYSSVKGTCSTCVPEYESMITDTIKYIHKNQYAYDDLNVETNKSKGYEKRVVWIQHTPQDTPHPQTVLDQDSDSHWFYLWNGVYVNSDYDLVSQGGYTDWYDNINKAKYYLDGGTGHPNDVGAVLNFYGGANNPAATGKTPSREKDVSIDKRITAYAADNGTPLEFLEGSDIEWSFLRDNGIPVLRKSDTSNTKWGTSHTMGSSNRKVYHQEYKNVTLSSVQDYCIDFNLSQSYSRTGINVKMDMVNDNTTTNKTYSGSGSSRTLSTCTSRYFPIIWESENVKVNSLYFRRYASDGANSTCRAVWDERMIVMYVKLSDGTMKQFNGFEWVNDNGNHQFPFFLGKMITYQNLFHNEMKYDMIWGSGNGAPKYTLKDEETQIYYDNNVGVVESESDADSVVKYRTYKSLGYDCVFDCGEGSLTIRLPYVDDLDATVYVDVYNSSILGMTGMDSSITLGNGDQEPFYYTLTDPDTLPTTDFKELKVYICFFPVNIAYVKAEHLDLDMEIKVPQSNLGQMFSESDIEYKIKNNQNYVEEFTGPSFQVNTFNPLVSTSWSYLMSGGVVADPALFTLNSVTARPETFTVQAYMNWLGTVRKIYTKTLVPEGGRTRRFSNIRTYITTPEVGSNELLVIKDSWDVKTDRHTIQAVEDNGLQVSSISTVNEAELPRMARSDRFNLPTSRRVVS